MTKLTLKYDLDFVQIFIFSHKETKYTIFIAVVFSNKAVTIQITAVKQH